MMAPADRMEAFFEQLRELMDRSGFLGQHNPGVLMARLRRLFLRARPDTVELNALQGMLASFGHCMTRQRGGSGDDGPPV